MGIASILIFINYAFGLISSLLLIEIQSMTGLSSLQEIFCFLGGGRASIFYICSIYILFFGFGFWKYVCNF